MIRGALVLHDGSARSEQTLTEAVELCRVTRAVLGLVVVNPPVCAFAWPVMCVVGAPISYVECDRIVRQIPRDLSVRFLSLPTPGGTREIAELARRLECDAVLLPYRGWRGRRMARALSKRGLRVLAPSLERKPPAAVPRPAALAEG